MKPIIDYASLTGTGNPLLVFCPLREAALDEFSRKSFEAASLNGIIKGGRMSKGSLYHHFGDKFGLYLALMDFILHGKRKVNEAVAAGLENSTDLFEALRCLIGANTAFLLEDRRVACLHSRFLHEDAVFRQRVVQLLPRLPSYDLTAICETSIDNGKVDPQYTPVFMLGVLNTLLNGFEQLLPPGYASEDVIAAVDQLQGLLRHGFAASQIKD